MFLCIAKILIKILNLCHNREKWFDLTTEAGSKLFLKKTYPDPQLEPDTSFFRALDPNP